MNKQIFISYRRDGGEFFGKILHDELEKRGYSVFFDVESLKAGAFNTQIYQIIDECTDFLVILPPNALDRCFEEGDWVAEEIRYALKKRKNIVPIMMKNFEWPEKMPEGMEQLPFYEGETFSSSVNQEHIQATINVLCNKLLLAQPHRFRRYRVPIIAGILLLAVIAAAVWLLNRSGENPTVNGGSGNEPKTTVSADEDQTGEQEQDPAYDTESYLHSIFQNNICSGNFENEICFLYADYDRDGSFEAYAATGNKAAYTYEGIQCYEDVSLYYIDSNAKIIKVAEPETGYNGCDASSQEEGALLDTGTDLYFVWECYSGGVYSRSDLYGVRGGRNYSPRCSGVFFGLHAESDHYEAWLDYPDYGHDRDLVWLMYEDSAHEFVTIARTFREDGSRQLKSLNTAPGLVVSDGSIVNIDYIERFNGNEMKLLGTSGSGVDVIVGSGTSIGDFEEQLIGHKVGETFTISVDVPEDYFIPDIAGEKVEFEITVNGIYK